VTDARISDPDDPTVQQAPFDQLVRGVEIGMNGYLTKIWELSANYTHLNDKITATSDPLSMDKSAPNTPHDAFNIWTTLEPTSAVAIAGGATAVSHRYADTENTAGVPGYVVFNAMTSYQFNDHLKLQVNLNNVANKLYFTSIYYVGVAENHALPSAGRTLIANASYRF
jgi:outer membrane receptor for monomeric catechols